MIFFSFIFIGHQAPKSPLQLKNETTETGLWGPASLESKQLSTTFMEAGLKSVQLLPENFQNGVTSILSRSSEEAEIIFFSILPGF